MSFLLTSDDRPFVFGAYAAHLNEPPEPTNPDPECEAALELPPAGTSGATTVGSLLES